MSYRSAGQPEGTPQKVELVQQQVLGDDFVDAALGQLTTFDRDLDELITELEGYLPPYEPGPDHLGFAVPLRLNTGDGELRLITTITSFATAVDVTVAELYLEAFLPADEPTADILRRTAE